jgi:hypothetical protein
MIVVDTGSVADPVRYCTPDAPPSPYSPRKLTDVWENWGSWGSSVLVGLVGCRRDAQRWAVGGGRWAVGGGAPGVLEVGEGDGGVG